MPALPAAESCVMGTVSIVGSRSMLQAPVRPVPGAGPTAAAAGKLVTANDAAAMTAATAVCPIHFLSILFSFQLSGTPERERRVGVRIEKRLPHLRDPPSGVAGLTAIWKTVCSGG